jgi:Uma2 family endonuclease
MGAPEEVRLTYADYRQLPEDGRRYEILEGRLEVSPSATLVHQTVVARLMALLLPWILERDLGRLLTAPLDVILSNDTIVQPDLLFVSRERLKAIAGRWIHGCPDLVIEVLSQSTSSRDLGAKRQIYARFGVQEYWIVDPEARSITLLALDGSAYRELGSGTGDRCLRSSILAGFQIVPAQVFQDL